MTGEKAGGAEYKWEGVRFYLVHVSASGRRSLRWSRPFGTAGDAKRYGKELIASEKATLCFVIRADGDDRRICGSYTEPGTARKIIQHYDELLEKIDGFVDEDDDNPDEQDA